MIIISRESIQGNGTRYKIRRTNHNQKQDASKIDSSYRTYNEWQKLSPDQRLRILEAREQEKTGDNSSQEEKNTVEDETINKNKQYQRNRKRTRRQVNMMNRTDRDIEEQHQGGSEPPPTQHTEQGKDTLIEDPLDEPPPPISIEDYSKIRRSFTHSAPKSEENILIIDSAADISCVGQGFSIMFYSGETTTISLAIKESASSTFDIVTAAAVVIDPSSSKNVIIIVSQAARQSSCIYTTFRTTRVTLVFRPSKKPQRVRQ
jgi:hypothetical protein